VASEDNNSETSNSDEDIEEKYVTYQVNNSESSNSETLQSVAMV
jgi:hypothetical protein